MRVQVLSAHQTRSAILETKVDSVLPLPQLWHCVCSGLSGGCCWSSGLWCPHISASFPPLLFCVLPGIVAELEQNKSIQKINNHHT